MLEIVWHSLTRRWVQSLATVISVAVSVGMLFALYRLYAGASLGLDVGARRLGADLLVVPGNTPVEPETLLFTGAPANIYMRRELEQKIAGLPGVRRTSAQFFAQTLNETCCSLSGATRLIGFDPATDWSVQAWGTGQGDRALHPNQIVVGAGVEGVAGNKAYILGQALQVITVLQATGTSLDYSVLMPIDAVRALSRTIPYLRVLLGKGNDPADFISAVLVETDQRADKEAVAAAIERVGDVRVIKASDVLGSIKQQMESLFFIMLGGGLLAALAAIVQLFARFSSLPWDRKGEWGLYRALGATRGDLKRLILGEAAILTGAGVAIGLLLGGALGLLAHAWLQGQRAFPFIEASWSKTALAIVVTAAAFGLVALVAAWWPARQSGRIAPSSAMAMGDID